MKRLLHNELGYVKSWSLIHHVFPVEQLLQMRHVIEYSTAKTGLNLVQQLIII